MYERHSRYKRHRRYQRYSGPEPVALAFGTNLPATANVAVGAALTLTVAVNGGKTPYTYVWKKGAAVVSGQTTATLNIPAAAAGDAGSYTCEVTDANNAKIVSSACVVTVA